MDAIIQSFTSDPDSLQFVDAAMRGGGGWTAQFHQTIEAAVDLIDTAGDTTTFDKTLNVAGRLEAGADGSVKELIVTSVEALPTDPMRRAWNQKLWNQTLDAARSFRPPDTSNLMAEYLKSMPSPTYQLNDLFKNMPSPTEQMRDLFKNMPTVSDQMREAFKNMPTVSDQMREFFRTQQPPSHQKNVEESSGPSNGDETTDDHEQPSTSTSDEPDETDESPTD
jgi:hypothetical protein